MKRLKAINQDLHSTMVRFAIQTCRNFDSIIFCIYIPLWLDLLSELADILKEKISHLHSTMVRFVIWECYTYEKIKKDLHSTMVRFVMEKITAELKEVYKFTFHYG